MNVLVKDYIKPISLNKNGSVDTPNRKAFLQRQASQEKDDRNPVLGKGSYGVVLRANYKGTPAAVKLVQIQKQANLREKAILHIIHDNIVNIFKIVKEQQFFLVIMEELKGPNLRSLLNNVKIDHINGFEIIKQVATGLLHCHSQNIIHLDIKPSNIIICLKNKGFNVKICDFGNSERLPKGEKEMFLDHMRGTIVYMAPELFQSKSVSRATDVYALGITMWEIETAQIPYSHFNSTHEIMYLVVRNHIRPDTKTHRNKVGGKLGSHTYTVYKEMDFGKTYIKRYSSKRKFDETYSIENVPLNAINMSKNKINIIDWEDSEGFENWNSFSIMNSNKRYSESVIENYQKLYKMCWKVNPKHRPTMQIVLDLTGFYLNCIE